MNNNALAKSIYDLAGILAACTGLIMLLTFVIVLGIASSSLMSETPTQETIMIWVSLIPPAVGLTVAVIITIACRHWSRRCASNMDAVAIADQDPQGNFALCSGVIGMVLILIVAYRLINEGDIRLAQGLSVDDRLIPFMSFIDLGIYLVLGVLLFARPMIPYRLWTRIGGGRHANA